MKKSQNDCYKIKGPITYIKRIISFLCVTLALFLIVFTFIAPYLPEFDERSFFSIGYFIVALIPFFFGLVIGTRKDVLVCQSTNIIKIVNNIEGIEYNSKKIHFKKLEGVSIFINRYGFFESRLYFDNGKNCYLFDDKDELKTFEKVTLIASFFKIPVYNNIVEGHYLTKSEPNLEPNKERKTVLFSTGNRSLFQSIIAAILYAITLFCIYYFIAFSIKNKLDDIKNYISFLNISLLSFGLALRFSLVKDYLFDINNKQYKVQFRVGPITYGSWKNFNTIEYISIFFSKKEVYQVNLWYNKNRNIKLGAYYDLDSAKEFAKPIADKLAVELVINDKQ